MAEDSDVIIWYLLFTDKWMMLNHTWIFFCSKTCKKSHGFSVAAVLHKSRLSSLPEVAEF